MQKLDIVNISEEQTSKAKLFASGMSEPLIRKRGMIDMLGLECAVNYFYMNKLRFDTRRSVHKIPLLFEEFKITDIYLNNYRIDVITLYKEKTVKIPKIHVDLDIMPHFYFVVQIGSKIKEAKMIGFIDSKSIAVCSHDSKYYYPTLDLLFDIKKFTSLIKRSTPTRVLLGKHIECMGLFLKFIDKDLSSAYKKQLIQHLMSCDACRERFIEVMDFERLAGNFKFYPDLTSRLENSRLRKLAQKEIQIEDEEETFAKRLEKETEKEPPKKAAMEVSKESINKQASNYKEQEASKNKEIIHEVLEQKPASKPVVITISPDEIKQKSKKVIDSIFNDMKIFDVLSLNALADGKNKRKIMIAIATLFVFASFAVISFNSSDTSKLNDDILMGQAQQDSILDEEGADSNYFDMLPPSTGEARLIPKERNIEEFTINAPGMPEAKYTPSITKISWEAPQSLVKKEDYTKYLQLIGKNIKLNLQNDLLLVNDVPMNKVVKTDIKVSSNGDIHSINIMKSSGSEIIDARIEKTVNETMTYMKPPGHGLLAKPADITLIIELH